MIDSMRSQPNAAVHFSAEFPRGCRGMGGPILSIVRPCFGQTGMECGQNVVGLPRAALSG
jgi:hypothetical protein